MNRALIVLLLLPTAAHAAPPCGDRSALLDALHRAEDKSVVGRAVTTAGDLYEVVANAKGDMSVVVTFATGVTVAGDGGRYTFPPGTACRVEEGAGWHALAPQPGLQI